MYHEKSGNPGVKLALGETVSNLKNEKTLTWPQLWPKIMVSNEMAEIH
jgi:hypothetical protein